LAQLILQPYKSAQNKQLLVSCLLSRSFFLVFS
jgi:hypothetical protein